MHVDAVFILGVAVFEIISEARYGRELVARFWIEIGVAAAAVDRAVSDAEICEPIWIVSPDWNIAGDVGHPIMHAEIPAYRGLGSEISEAAYAVGAPPGYVQSKRPQGPGQGRINSDLVAPKWYEHGDGRLATQNRRCKYVTRNGHPEVRISSEPCVHIASEWHCEPAGRHLARESDVRSGRYRRMIIDASE